MDDLIGQLNALVAKFEIEIQQAHDSGEHETAIGACLLAEELIQEIKHFQARKREALAAYLNS